MTFEEYLQRERAGEIKHEYVDGYVYPHQDWVTGLAGAGKAHNLLAGEIQYLLMRAARERRDFFVFGSDMLVRIPHIRRSYYPDVHLVCDPADDGEDYSTRPCLIIEVLSRSTARVDRGEKLVAYQSIPALQAYWIVSQTERPVTRWWRDSDQGAWRDEEMTTGELPVPCLDAQIAIADIYSRALT